mgnify:CR=1 FL=1
MGVAANNLIVFRPEGEHLAWALKLHHKKARVRQEHGNTQTARIETIPQVGQFSVEDAMTKHVRARSLKQWYATDRASTRGSTSPQPSDKTSIMGQKAETY